MKKIVIKAGHKSSLQFHESKDETNYVLELLNIYQKTNGLYFKIKQGPKRKDDISKSHAKADKLDVDLDGKLNIV